MWFLAFKQMFSRKKQTILIFLGISFGTMIYVIIAGVQLGMREYIAEQLLNNTAHVIISGNERVIDKDDIRERTFPSEALVQWILPPAGKREESRLDNPQGWFLRLENSPDVVAYAPKLTVNAIVSRGSLRQNITLSGILPERHTRVTNLEEYMKEGSLLQLSG